MDEQRFDTLVASIYQAAAGRTPWREPLDALAEAFDSPRCILTGVMPATLRPAFRDEGGRGDAEAICEALRTAHGDDPILARLVQGASGQWLHEAEVAAADVAPRAAGVLAPAGLGFAAGVRLDGGTLAVVLALTRGRRRLVLDAGQRESLARIAFHVEAALAIEARRSPSPIDEAPGFEAVASNRHPLWIVDGHRRVHWRNAAAEALRERADRLVEIDGRLHCADPQEDVELACALVRLGLGRSPTPADHVPRRAVMRAGGIDPGAHAILLTERSRADEDAPALAMVRCHPLQHDAEPDPALVAEAFELTPAEARVAAQLARGLSAVEIAAGRGVSTQTIRAQIRAVFEKTGINRQSDLIRLLVEMPDADGGDAQSPARHGDEAAPGREPAEGTGDPEDTGDPEGTGDADAAGRV